MKPTVADLEFFNAVDMPGWAYKLRTRQIPDKTALLHYAINVRAEIAMEHLEAGNTLAVLKLVRKRERLSGYMAKQLEQFVGESRRLAFYRKWLKRMI